MKAREQCDKLSTNPCLPLMWRLSTGIIGEKVYNHLRDKGILPPEQNGEKIGCRRIKGQLMVDKMILRNCRRRLTILAVAWIDYTKAYNMVPHWWIIQCMEWFSVANNARKTLEKCMGSWKVELTSAGETMGEVKIKRGIFQGDRLSPSLFV